MASVREINGIRSRSRVRENVMNFSWDDGGAIRLFVLRGDRWTFIKSARSPGEFVSLVNAFHMGTHYHNKRDYYFTFGSMHKLSALNTSEIEYLYTLASI